MKFTNLLKASGSNEILAVIENLPVTANGYFLTEGQAESIESALAAGQSPEATADLQRQLTEANSARQAAEASLVTANTTIAAHVATIGTHQARITELEADVTLQQTTRDNDQKTKIPFHNSNENPMNALRNQVFPGMKN